jgi:predicted acyl esterase
MRSLHEARYGFQLCLAINSHRHSDRGHRDCQSTWFPFVDRNPQSYVPNIFEAEADDFISATHRVYRSAEHPTSLLVGVL